MKTLTTLCRRTRDTRINVPKSSVWWNELLTLRLIIFYRLQFNQRPSGGGRWGRCRGLDRKQQICSPGGSDESVCHHHNRFWIIWSHDDVQITLLRDYFILNNTLVMQLHAKLKKLHLADINDAFRILLRLPRWTSAIHMCDKCPDLSCSAEESHAQFNDSITSWDPSFLLLCIFYFL